MNRAYHSHHMQLVAEYYRGLMDSLADPVSTDIKFYSSLFGHLVKGSRLEPTYWVDNLTQAVRFSEAVTSMCAPVDGNKTGVNMLIEIGPHSALGGPVKQILKSCGAIAMKIPYTSALVRNKDAVQTAIELASTLFVKGASLNLGAINLPPVGKPPALLVDMPRYPWNHQTKYWHEPRLMQKQKNRSVPRNDLLGTIANYSNDLEPTWRNILRIDDVPWLRHHKIQSLNLFPMSGFIAMAVEAASQRAALRNMQYEKFELRDVSVHTALMVTGEDIEMTLQLRPYQDGGLGSSNIWDEFRVHSWASNKGWTEHCKGLIAVKGNDQNDFDGGRIAKESEALLKVNMEEIAREGTTYVDKTALYESLSELGVEYGPSFQGMNNCQASDICSTADITSVDTKQEMPQVYETPMIIHPALLEQLIEMYWPILGAGRTSVDTIYLPSSIGRISISRKITELTQTPGDSLRAFCRGAVPLSHPVPVQLSMFATAANDTPEILIRVDELTVAPIVERAMASENVAHRELCYKLEWEPIFETSAGSTSNGIANGANNGEESTFADGDMVIIHGDSESQTTLASSLADALKHLTGKRPEVGTLAHIKTDGKICLFLSELDKTLLSTLTLDQFTALQSVLTSVQGVLWVVRGAYANSSNPDANMISGLSRSIRSETLLKFAILDLDFECVLDQAGTMKAILNVFKATFAAKAEANCELEFMERNGKFFTPRIVNDDETNEYVHKQTKASVLESTPFAQDERPLQMAIGELGAYETLHFVDQIIDGPIPEGEVELEVKAIGMNLRDTAPTIRDRENYDFGLECSGIITRIGAKVTDVAVGDRVTGISVNNGVYSTYARTKATHLFKVSDGMSLEAAASIPVAFCTAKYSLLHLGRIEEGESVLIHGATSSVGQAAIVLAQMLGAKIFATVGEVACKELLMKEYGIPESHIFSSQQTSFVQAIRQGTDDRAGVDIVLNCVSTETETSRELWDCLSNFGRFVDIGKEKGNATLDMAHNRSFLSCDLEALALERPKILARLLSDIDGLLKENKIKPIGQTTIFPIADIQTAFKVLQSGDVTGKLIVSPQPGNKVKVRFLIPSAK
jgi:NADPH:quinone reductase-like Zn-dependent oxidoreductase